MIETTGRVCSVESGLARVKVERQSSCGSCAAAAGCGTATLANWLPRRSIEFQVADTLGLKAGDRVILGIDEAVVRFGAIWLYAVPLAGLIAGAVFGEWLFARRGLDTELGAVAFGLSGLTVALLSVRQHLLAVRWAGDKRVRLLRRADRVTDLNRMFAGPTPITDNTKRDRGT